MSNNRTGIERIAAERQRQIDAEGWTPEHDDEHDEGELAIAGACYAVHDCITAVPSLRLTLETQYADIVSYSDPWPWEGQYKPSADPIRNLEKAGALIAAEIDRLLRRQP